MDPGVGGRREHRGQTGSDLLAHARAAYARCAWADAYRALVAADGRDSLGAEDLERLATSAYLTGHDDVSTSAWTRAHHARIEGGEPRRAVHCAFWLGFGLIQQGATAQGGGWLARARGLVKEHGLDCVEAGYLLVPAALMVMGGGDPAAAHELFEQANAAAQRFGDPDLLALGCVGRGQALLRMGRTAEGLDLFDRAMVAVTAGELSPTVAGIVYCAVIEECQQCFDVRRAAEWTAALGRWCDAQPGLVPYRGQCLVHRSQVLQLRGAWREALDEARRARERLARPPQSAVGMAYYQLGELHRLRGEPARAEEAYRRANEHGRRPQPGLALLRLAQGRVDAAVTAVERAADEAHDELARVRILPAAVEIMLAAGRVDAARAAADQLTRVAVASGAVYLFAAASSCRGAVLLASGEPEGALQELREACRRWHEVEAAYEMAQTRVLVGLACRRVDDHDGAELERDAARRAFEEMGAAPALARVDELFGVVGGAARDDRAPRTHCTRRELEVLRLVAAGRTNRQIADQLVISEKTVERHLSNIFARIGVSNRAAATAYAYDHALV